jgi:hypothetical protein
LKFAWLSARLESYLTVSARLHAAAGNQAGAAEDLIHLVSEAPRLGDLASFRSVRMDVQAGNLTLSIEEVDMHARPLPAAGVPQSIASRASLPDYAAAEALVVQDLHVRGASILRRAS